MQLHNRVKTFLATLAVSAALLPAGIATLSPASAAPETPVCGAEEPGYNGEQPTDMTKASNIRDKIDGLPTVSGEMRLSDPFYLLALYVSYSEEEGRQVTKEELVSKFSNESVLPMAQNLVFLNYKDNWLDILTAYSVEYSKDQAVAIQAALWSLKNQSIECAKSQKLPTGEILEAPPGHPESGTLGEAPPSEPAVSEPPAPAPPGCPEASPGNRRPVLLVHGYIGNPSRWTEMKSVLDKIPDVAAVTFDYSKVNTHWVDDPEIGPRLAQCISHLANSSGRQVAIIAHSMGGLAVREAVNEKPDLARQIGLVITIATPNLGSSVVKLLVEGLEGGSEAGVSRVSPETFLIWHALVWACNSTDSPPPVEAAEVCSIVSSPLRTVLPAGLREMSMGPGSRLNQLPALPTTVPVLAIAGRAILVNGIFDHSFHINTDSDLIVQEESATWGGTQSSPGGTWVFSCGWELSGSPGWEVWRVSTRCWHSGLPSAPDVEERVTAALREMPG